MNSQDSSNRGIDVSGVLWVLVFAVSVQGCNINYRLGKMCESLEQLKIDAGVVSNSLYEMKERKNAKDN